VDWNDPDSQWEIVTFPDQRRLGLYPTMEAAISAAVEVETQPPETQLRALKVTTDAYYSFWKRRPRPSQRESWKFKIDGPGQVTWFTHTGTYRQAVKAVKDEAARLGWASSIGLCPFHRRSL
jgi:hypothetical protein